MVKEELINPDIEKEMEEIKNKTHPTALEKVKLIRYYINVYEHPEDKILEILKHWNPDEVKEHLMGVLKENSKKPPKRYYVSLKEPLEDSKLR
jgi:hypothetical protein